MDIVAAFRIFLAIVYRFVDNRIELVTARISYFRTSERILNTLLICFVCLDFVPVDSLFHTVSKQPFGGFQVY